MEWQPGEFDARLSGDPIEVAPRLLGCQLTHAGVTVRITEVEAYAGQDDPGSHAFGGPTPRTATMFGPAGHLYCYLSYGIHVCVNVTVSPRGTAGAVLVRAGEVIAGGEIARTRAPHRAPRELARGPGRLGQVLGLELGHDGVDLRGDQVTLTRGAEVPLTAIASGPRVGLSRAADRPWRFWLHGEPTVSAYRRSPRATPAPR